MLTKKAQAITGVSPDFECIVEELHPSIASTGIGDFLNRLYGCIPMRVWGIKISNLLFVLPTAPLGALIYLGMKVFGSRYIITTRNVKCVAALGHRLIQSVAISQIAGISIDPDSRQSFFKTGDVRLTDISGNTLMLMRGIPYPERLQQVIVELRDAKSQVAASLARIQARK